MPGAKAWVKSTKRRVRIDARVSSRESDFWGSSRPPRARRDEEGSDHHTEPPRRRCPAPRSPSGLLRRLYADRDGRLGDVGTPAVRALDLPVAVMLFKGLLLVEGLRALLALELVQRHGWSSFAAESRSDLPSATSVETLGLPGELDPSGTRPRADPPSLTRHPIGRWPGLHPGSCRGPSRTAGMQPSRIARGARR